LPHAQSFRYFNSSPGVIRLRLVMYVRYPLSLRQDEDLLFERGIDICHEPVRFWNRFGPMFAAAIRKRRVRRAALEFLKRALKRYGRPGAIVTDRLRSYGAALKAIGIAGRQQWGPWVNNRAENKRSAMAKFRDVRTLQKFAAVTPRSTITSISSVI
jgi:putative transposase